MVSAWLFARDRAKFDSRGVFYALSLLVAVCVILAMQPDIGQMTLLALVWMCMYFLAGGSMRLLAMLTMAAVLVGLYLYETKPHVASRIDRFIDPSSGDTYQVDRAMDAIKSGGIVGVGVGDGRIKSFLPDAHSDYVFAVAAEEGGLIIGGLIIFWLAFWSGAPYGHCAERDHWVQLSAAGLTCLFGLQAVINLAVNLNLAVQRYDITLCVLWRLIAAWLCPDDGHVGCPVAPTHQWPRAFAKPARATYGGRIRWRRAMSRHNVILLAAGGTAGHMFPASALARELKNDGYQVHLATDRRGLRFIDQMEKMTVHKIPAATVFGGGVLALPVRALTLLYGFLYALVILLRIRPDVIVGFGGYPSFPPVFAGMILRKPVLIHEQNAVLGRANRLAALLGASLATSFNKTAMPWGAGLRLRKTGQSAALGSD